MTGADGRRDAAADPLDLSGIERVAAVVLSREVGDFIAGGSGRERSLAANRAAFDAVFVRPRVLADVSGCAPDSTLLGRPARMPLAVGPVAYHRLAHPDGELATARAAKAAGVPFTLAMLSSVPVEEVTAVGGAVWFQLYWLRDTGRTLELARRAEDAGCEALVLTVDVPWMGRRLRDVRNGFALPDGVRAAHLGDAPSAAHRGGAGASAVAAHTAELFSPSLTWTDVERLRTATRLPLVLKGVLDPEDARRAVEYGADALVVSNHGGRQLDGAVPGLLALPAVREAVGAAYEVLVDGGVRGGTDVLKALALGASGVLVGRPPVWGLATGGEDGVRRVLELFAAELTDALGLAGCATPAEARRLTTVTVRP
ncbi:alpha-hydroxy acid oxidase [Streptomyces sp. NPDC048290]|uniref:alpha-hydroxy acid oxidase n=1 Tax=Streptomyces sp. NPDC048290 TaxID=3155811 RepID=UPI00342132E9